MAVSFSDLQLAFEFVSSGGMGENEAYLDRQSGKIYWHTENSMGKFSKTLNDGDAVIEENS